jgi:hypothetical protein
VLLARFERLLDWTRYWVPALDDRGLCLLLFNRLKEVVWRTGRALMEEGITHAVHDVQLLTPADLRRIVESRDPQAGRALGVQRRWEFERNRRLSAPAFLGARPGEDPSPASAASDTTQAKGDGSPLKGRSMTPWSASGVAHTARRLDDALLLASLSRETILVCDGSSIGYYADWVSVFLVIAGLVIVGPHSGMHHAIQIARECGIAFVHLRHADLSTLRDGVRIAIDGGDGAVTLLQENGRNDNNSVERTR